MKAVGAGMARRRTAARMVCRTATVRRSSRRHGLVLRGTRLSGVFVSAGLESAMRVPHSAITRSHGVQVRPSSLHVIEVAPVKAQVVF